LGIAAHTNASLVAFTPDKLDRLNPQTQPVARGMLIIHRVLPTMIMLINDNTQGALPVLIIMIIQAGLHLL
jgi:hypothetical protein